ncbi:MAG: AAA family ATPase, partial [Bacteroidales bacterium]|nr:AAA family ATPase [Bacteroidales bacterium]
ARRFIFKVEFSTPEAETRAKIWRSMIDGLTEEDASVLGKEYTFSGGNIENIARKAAVGYVLSGSRADLAELRKYCDEETLADANKHNRIGY